VKIEHYVIMPDHIHAIIFLNPKEYAPARNGSSKAPTPTNQMLPHIITTFKRFCNREIGFNIFQRGYMEHIIRDYDDYETRARYIHENPMRRYYDELQSK
jgi:REP element-mobilizing transposase RayT